VDSARRISRPTLIIGIALIAVVVLGLTAIIIGRAWSGRDHDGRRGGPVTVSAPTDGRDHATLEVLDGVSELRLHAGAPGDDLYRITGSGVSPRVDQDDDTFRLGLGAVGDSSTSTVDIAVASGVAWTLRLDGGTRRTAIDLTGGRVTAIDLSGGASLIEVDLPAPDALVPVRMTGGVDQFHVRRPAAVSVRAQLGSGAGQVTIDGTPHQGVAGGQSFTAGNWQAGAAGVDVQATAGVGTLVITPR